MRVVCDSTKCIGCLECVITCVDHHFAANDENAIPARLKKKVALPNGYTRYETYSCLHCENAACMKACPVSAIKRTPDGLVIVDQKLCIGCRLCKNACKYDIPRFLNNGKMFKCDGCSGEYFCVKMCPNGALSVK